MFTLILSLHSLLRWAVIGLGAVVSVRALGAWLAGRPAPAPERLGRAFVIALDVQLLLGLLLHLVLSPVTTSALANMGDAMGNAVTRFWTVEHPTLMIVAVALAHIGLARCRRATDLAARHRTAALFFTVALLLVLVGTPWPFSTASRPLLPW